MAAVKRKRGFRTDGSSHKQGVKNEIDIVKHFNDNENTNINNHLKEIYKISTSLFWKHIGGTKNENRCDCYMW